VNPPALTLSFSLEKVERAMTLNEVFLGIKWVLKIPNDTFWAKNGVFLGIKWILKIPNDTFLAKKNGIIYGFHTNWQ